MKRIIEKKIIPQLNKTKEDLKKISINLDMDELYASNVYDKIKVVEEKNREIMKDLKKIRSMLMADSWYDKQDGRPMFVMECEWH